MFGCGRMLRTCPSALARHLPSTIRCLSTLDMPAQAPKYPTLETAAAAASNNEAHEFTNELLIVLAASGDAEARTERFIREVMHVDQLEWPEAKTKVDGFVETAIPILCPSPNPLWNVTGGAIVVGGFVSIPMVFSHDFAMWTNRNHVSYVDPPETDIDTFLEVGSWAWGWMEPPLGTISFVILAWQLGMQTMTTKKQLVCPLVKQTVKTMPQYNFTIVRAWAESVKDIHG